jgi:hypothetical protein
MVALPFPAPGAAWWRSRSLSGWEILGRPNDVPPLPKNLGGCEPFAGEPRSQETAGCHNLGRGFTLRHKATR